MTLSADSQILACDQEHSLVSNNTTQPFGWSAVSDFQFCKVMREGAVLTITINRPEVLNALHPAAHAELAAAFERITGHPARYIDTELDAYWNGPLKTAASLPAGYNADPDDKSTMSFRVNFTGFWNIWKHKIVTRDYALLDEIHPNRIKSAEQWLRHEDQLGRKLGKGSLWERIQPENLYKAAPLLKLTEDRRKGRL